MNISTQLKKILTAEQPATLLLLARRIAEQQGVSCTQKLQHEVEAELDKFAYCDPFGRSVSPCYWTDIEASIGYTGFRADTGREIGEMPLVEVMNAMRTVVEQSVSIPTDALVKHTAKVLGFGRMGARIQDVMERALAALSRMGVVVEENGSVKMRE